MSPYCLGPGTLMRDFKGMMNGQTYRHMDRKIGIRWGCVHFDKVATLSHTDHFFNSSVSSISSSIIDPTASMIDSILLHGG